MPIRQVKGGYRWGGRGAIYPTKKQAARQARAAYASGYVGEGLVHLVAEARQLLSEGVSVRTDTSKLDVLLKELLDQISDKYSEQDIRKEEAHWKSEIEKSVKGVAAEIQAAVSSLSSWHGSSVLVRMQPTWVYGKDALFNDDGDVSRTAEVVVFDTSPRMAPSFTYFRDKTVDDVLDAGDTDFFRNPEVEADYFALVTEIRHPGRAAREADKVVTLYTARPVKDRDSYEGARVVPSNIFLTTSFDEAEGYGHDFGSRDIWKMRVKKRHLLLTLDTPRLKNYQAYASGGKVPIESIELAAAG